jgi:hypothetical protein
MSDQTPPPETAEPVTPEAEPVAPAPTPDDDAAIEQQLTEHALDLPEGEKLVPLSAVTSVREKLKAAREKASRADTLEAEMARLRAEMDESRPYVDAAKALLAAQQMRPDPQQAPPTGESPEVVAELTDLAKDLDLYRVDGTPDLEKAKRIYERNAAIAARAAQAVVAPMQQQTVSQQSSVMLQRAMLAKAPNGETPDPDILKNIWSRLDPRLTATEAGAQQAWLAAMGQTIMAGKTKPTPKAETAPLPAPLVTERAGGRDTPMAPPLSDAERRIIKDLGLTEKQYLEADTRPWRR